MIAKLPPDVVERTRRRPSVRSDHLIEQGHGALDRNEKAELIPRRRHVDADHSPGLVDRRPAAHSGVERPGEVNSRMAGVREMTVVRPLHNAQAEVFGMAERVQPVSLRDGDAGE